MTFVPRRLILTGVSVFLCIAPSVVLAQIASVSKVEALDAGIVPPTSTGVLGKVDPQALAEVTAHLATVGQTPWTEMQGTGRITYADDKVSYPATFSMKGGDRFRLDAQTAKGTESIRINGLMGKAQGPDGTETEMPPNAAAVGIFPFQVVRATHFTGKRTSLLDHGLVDAGGVQLHRITVENATIGRDPLTKSPRTTAIDLYFDPSTHLLVKSATHEMLGVGRSASFLRVVTYSDYRLVGSSMIPFRYAESMDGEQYQVLQLSDVQLQPTFDAKYFQF